MTLIQRPDIGTLEYRPALHLDDVVDNLELYSSMLCCEYLPLGLASLQVALTKERYDALGLTITDPATQKNVPIPKPSIPEKPADPPKGTNNYSIVVIYKTKLEKYLAIHRGIGELRDTLISALGTTIRLNLKGRIAEMSLSDILTYLDTTYGKPSDSDIDFLKSTLAVEFKSTEAFSYEAARMRKTYRKLKRFNHEMTPDDQMEKLVQATRAIPPIVFCINHYNFQFPVHEDRSFDDMVKYIEIQLPTVDYLAKMAPNNPPPSRTPTPATTQQLDALAHQLISAMVKYLTNNTNATGYNSSNRPDWWAEAPAGLVLVAAAAGLSELPSGTTASSMGMGTRVPAATL